MDMTPIVISAVNPFFSFLSLIFSGFITYITLKIDQKSDDFKDLTNTTHDIINNNMAIQLKIVCQLAEKIALLSKDPKDIAEAEAAKKLYKDHMAKQTRIDQAKSA